MLVVGEREAEAGEVSLRRNGAEPRRAATRDGRRRASPTEPRHWLEDRSRSRRVGRACPGSGCRAGERCAGSGRRARERCAGLGRGTAQALRGFGAVRLASVVRVQVVEAGESWRGFGSSARDRCGVPVVGLASVARFVSVGLERLGGRVVGGRALRGVQVRGRHGTQLRRTRPGNGCRPARDHSGPVRAVSTCSARDEIGPTRIRGSPRTSRRYVSAGGTSVRSVSGRKRDPPRPDSTRPATSVGPFRLGTDHAAPSAMGPE